MVLVVKSKAELIATIKTGKKDKEKVIQTCGPYITKFHLSDVRGFTQDDIKFIMKDLPEYCAVINGLKNYQTNLEANKGQVLEKLKAKYSSLIDASVMDMKIDVNQKFKFWIDYETSIKGVCTVYTTNIEDYDPFNNNLLEG